METILAAGISLLLFAYLLVAMLRPESSEPTIMNTSAWIELDCLSDCSPGSLARWDGIWSRCSTRGRTWLDCVIRPVERWTFTVSVGTPSGARLETVRLGHAGLQSGELRIHLWHPSTATSSSTQSAGTRTVVAGSLEHGHQPTNQHQSYGGRRDDVTSPRWSR